MRPAAYLFLLLLFLVPARASAQVATPADAVALAGADLRKLPKEDHYYYRYLWLQQETAEKRKQAWSVIAGHLNSLSRSPTIVRPTVVFNDGATADGLDLAPELWGKATLLRFRWDEYKYDPEIYEKLRLQDFTFHAKLVETWPGGFDPRYGKEFKAGKYTVTAHAPWLATTAEEFAWLKYLVEETKSQAPILLASNFFWQTAVDNERNVGYHALLEFKNRDEFFALAGFDPKFLKLRPEALTAMGKSGVARQPRRIGRFASVGVLLRTFDSGKAVEEKNPLIFIDKGFRFEAEEDFCALPNGMWATGLFNEKGELQATAPDFVGYDVTSRSNDGRIRNYLSCLGCHDSKPGRGGLQDISSWIKNLDTPPPFKLAPADYDNYVALRDKYSQDLKKAIARDRTGYVDALAQCNGTTPDVHARNMLDFFESYDEAVDLQRAAREMGCDPRVLQRAVEKYGTQEATRGYQNTAAAMFALPDKRREALPIEQFHETINLLHLELRNLVAWPDAVKTHALKP